MFFYIFLSIYVAICLLNIAFPRQLWKALSSWQYKNPGANEPSKLGYLLYRVGGAAGLIVAAAILISRMNQ